MFEAPGEGWGGLSSNQGVPGGPLEASTGYSWPDSVLAESGMGGKTMGKTWVKTLVHGCGPLHGGKKGARVLGQKSRVKVGWFLIFPQVFTCVFVVVFPSLFVVLASSVS